jgi:DNA-binding Lrp family transcriptional regulator
MSKTRRNLTEAKKTHHFTERQLAALVTPRTREVFEILRKDGPMSVGQLQDALDFQSKTLYYQVRKLLKAGLVRPETPEIGAELFDTVAKRFGMPSGFQGIRYERLAAKGVLSILRKQGRRFLATAEASNKDPHVIDRLYIRTATLKLSQQRFDRLKMEIDALVAKYGSRQDNEESSVEMVLVLAPREPT